MERGLPRQAIRVEPRNYFSSLTSEEFDAGDFLYAHGHPEKNISKTDGCLAREWEKNLPCSIFRARRECQGEFCVIINIIFKEV